MEKRPFPNRLSGLKGVQMIVRFGLALDGKIPERPETRIGHVSAGPQGFLSILETQLGLSVPNISPAGRMVQYHDVLTL